MLFKSTVLHCVDDLNGFSLQRTCENTINRRIILRCLFNTMKGKMFTIFTLTAQCGRCQAVLLALLLHFVFSLCVAAQPFRSTFDSRNRLLLSVLAEFNAKLCRKNTTVICFFFKKIDFTAIANICILLHTYDAYI